MGSDYGFNIERKNSGYGNPRYGKYRGQVLINIDPLMMGRIKAICPKVLGPGVESAWASPCLPPGFKYLPKVGEYIWLEFEEGDPTRPIWVGVWYVQGSYIWTSPTIQHSGPILPGPMIFDSQGQPIQFSGLSITSNGTDINADSTSQAQRIAALEARPYP